MKVLLVEDHARLSELIVSALRRRGFTIDPVSDGTAFDTARRTEDYDVYLMDLGLPDGDGIDLIRDLRRTGDHTPVLVITARGTVGERIAGLDTGADDYLVKPFHVDELLARIRALARRLAPFQPNVRRIGTATLDIDGGRLETAAAGLALTPRETALLERLSRHRDRVVAKETLEALLSDHDHPVTSNAVEAAISRLRRRLDALGDGLSIETVRGVGYRLATEAR